MVEQPAPHHGPVVSFWPILVAVGISLLIIGIISSVFISIVGLVVLLFSLAGWTQENRDQPHPEEAEDQDQEGEREVVP
jgi:hypothetical protein